MSDEDNVNKDDLKKEIERLEGKIENLDERTKARIQTTEESKKTLNEVNQDLIDTKIGAFEKRFRDLSRFVYILIILFTVLLSYMGMNTKQMINYTVSETVKERLKQSYIDSLIQVEGNLAIEKSISSLYMKIDSTVKVKSKIVIESLKIEVDSLLKFAKSKVNEISELKSMADMLFKKYKNLDEKVLQEVKNDVNLDEFKELLQNYKTKNEYTAEDWYLLGIADDGKGIHKDAIEKYTNSIELNPKHAMAYFKRGYDYRIINKYKEAIQDLT